MPKKPNPDPKAKKTAGQEAAASAAPGQTVPCSNCGKPANVPPDAKPGQRLFCATCTAAWQAGPRPRQGK